MHVCPVLIHERRSDLTSINPSRNRAGAISVCGRHRSRNDNRREGEKQSQKTKTLSFSVLTFCFSFRFATHLLIRMQGTRKYKITNAVRVKWNHVSNYGTALAESPRSPFSFYSVFFFIHCIDKMTRFQCWPETLAITFTAIIIWNEVFMSKQQVDTQYDNRSLSVTNTNAGSDSI